MLDLYKSKNRFFTYFFIFLISISIVLAIDECKGTITQDDLPCGVYLPRGSNNCSQIVVQFFNESTSLYSQTMDNLNNFTCNSTFNQTDLGTYTFNYTTGDTGSIVVEEGNMLALLMYFGIIAAFGLMAFGLIGRDDTFASIGAIMLIIMGIFVFLNGFQNLDNLFTRTIAISFWGIGFYVLFRVNIERLKDYE